MLPDSKGPLSASLPSHAMPKLVMLCPCRCQQHTSHCFCCKILQASSVIKVTVVHQHGDQISDGWFISARVHDSKFISNFCIFFFNFHGLPHSRDVKIFYTKFFNTIFFQITDLYQFRRKNYLPIDKHESNAHTPG